MTGHATWYRPLILLLILGSLAMVAATACASEEEPDPTATPNPTSTPTAPAGEGTPQEDTPTPSAATATPTPANVDLPNTQSDPGSVHMVLVNLAGAPGSLPDSPLGLARQLGAAESLFTPGEETWDQEMLAESWDLADDLSSVTIDIRQGVRFHGDWGELTAEDMAWVINRTNPAINPESIAASAANLSALFGDTPVEAVDEYTIQASFSNFDVRWASNILNQEATGGLTTMATSKQAFDENGANWLRSNFVGTGPLQQIEHTEEVSGTYEAVPYDHWRKNPDIDQFRVTAVPEESTRLAMLETGQADVAFISPKDHARVHNAGFIQVSAGQGIQEGVIFPGNLWDDVNAITEETFDPGSSAVYVNDHPWLGNPWSPDDDNNPSGIDDMEQARLVRQALARSVDREAIITHVLGGVGTPVHVNWFSVDDPHWSSEWEYPFDPEEAESLLDQAGYPRDGDTRFEMPFFVGPELGGGAGPAGEIGDAIGGFWRDIGIDTQVLKYAYSVFRPGLVERTAVTPMLTSCDDGKASFPWNWPKGLVMTTLTRGGFSCGNEDPQLREWYVEASREPDVERRNEISTQLVEYMHEQALYPGYVTVPQAYFANPNYVEAWPQHLGNTFNSPENIVLAE